MARFTSLLSRKASANHRTKEGDGGLRRFYHGAVRLLHVRSPRTSQRSYSSPKTRTSGTTLRSRPENATDAAGLSSSDSDLSDASGASAHEPASERDPSVQLHSIGTQILRNFHEITSLQDTRWPDSHCQLILEGQRFLLWARNLGLHRQGHASLDYRVRDATAVKGYLADVLTELQDNLDNILSVMKGERPPFEEGEAGQSEISDSSRDGSDDDGQKSRKVYRSDSSRSSGSLHEVSSRQRNTAETIDSLYSLATRLRNPRNRPQRTIGELYKHIPPFRRTEYIREREAFETMVVSYIHSQALAQSIARATSQETNHEQDDELLPLQAELVVEYASPSHFLIRRTGAANARRKQQFTYWKEHAARIGYDPAATQRLEDQKGKQVDTLANDQIPSGTPQPQYEVDVDGWAAPSSMQDRSLATSATRVDADAFMPEDFKSTISYQSRITAVSAAPTWAGHTLDWPIPPEKLSNGDPPPKYFTCPYCHVICPHQYLGSKDTWRSHLIHDLQPYHCTYNNCLDPSRLYGSQQEWIDHENQHARVWHCYEHGDEFETQRDYVEHLKAEHPSEKLKHSSPELIATAVGPSLKPRECPFCPTALDTSAEMYKHLKYHLERLALLVLPRDEEDDPEDASGNPSDSQQIMKGRGRQMSLDEDFEDGSDFSSLQSRQAEVDQTPIDQSSREIAARLEWKRFLESSESTEDKKQTLVHEWMREKQTPLYEEEMKETAKPPLLLNSGFVFPLSDRDDISIRSRSSTLAIFQGKQPKQHQNPKSFWRSSMGG